MTLLALAVLVAALYQLAAIVACLRHLARREAPAVDLPAISLLKPLRGTDPDMEEALRSHFRIDYPEHELLFGVTDPQDPAAAVVRQLIAQHPNVPARLLVCSTLAPNRKVGVLMDLAQHARHGVWLVNDGDILVPPDYLRRVVGPLADPGVGLVTCLYRARAHTWPARWEALGIATDFAPSVLVAPLTGVSEFGLGSTLAFRAESLERAGGFAAVADYLADDYQLGSRLARSGLRNHLSSLVVETSLSGDTWAEVWRHQVRWARTIRVSRGGGYLGLPVTHASLWALVALLSGAWGWALALLGLRWLMAYLAAVQVLRSRQARADLVWVPFRDLWGFAVWVTGLVGREVEWRGSRLRLRPDGRIEPIGGCVTPQEPLR